MTPAPSCVHTPDLSDCPTQGCFRKLPCSGANEAWGLGKYTLVKTGDGFFARLIYSLKYARAGSTNHVESLQELSDQVSRFLTLKYRKSFDGCVIIPSNRSETAPVMHEVAQRLRGQDLVRSQEYLHKSGFIPVLKDLNRLERTQAVADKYQLGPVSKVPISQRILVLDDIYDSGATLEAAVATIRASAPKAHIVALTATYLRDPRES